MLAHHAFTSSVSPIPPPSLHCLYITLIHSLSLSISLSFSSSLSHPLSVCLCLSCLSTAAGSCLFVPLGYRWCNQTGRSHRLALTLADTNQKKRDREKERKTGKAGKTRQEADDKSFEGLQYVLMFPFHFPMIQINRHIDMIGSWVWWTVVLPCSWPSVGPAGGHSPESPWQRDKAIRTEYSTSRTGSISGIIFIDQPIIFIIFF